MCIISKKIKRVMSGGKEFNQDGSKGFRLDHVILSCQSAIVRIGQCLCQRLH